MARQSAHVRRFRSAAAARLAEAEVLRHNKLSLGAVYLAGYAVECALKALLLSAHPARGQAAVVAGFRGTRSHDFGWLRAQYQRAGGAEAPKAVAQAFAELRGWGTHLRYEPRTRYTDDEDEFFDAVAVVLGWVNARL